VRESNPDRIVIVDSYFWSASDYLARLELPEDPNVVASFHMYQPILFTHQGAPWMDPEYGTVGVVFPGPPATPLVPVPAAEKVGWVKQWFEGYNTGPAREQPPPGPAPCSRTYSPPADVVPDARSGRGSGGKPRRVRRPSTRPTPKSRANSSARARGAERRGIGWAYWDDGGMNRASTRAPGNGIDFLRAALLD
jgi:endoglucanase